MKRRNWTSEEDAALLNIVQEHGNRDWIRNSLLLQLKSGEHRSGKQCRQRWFNHLRPNIKKVQWAPQQNQTVFNLHRIYGNKWKKISEHFPGRTDNCVKNHFYSTLRKSLRRFNKYIGYKNSTEHIKLLKPTFLTQILNFMYEKERTQSDSFLTEIKELPSILYHFSLIKPKKRKMVDEEMQKIIKTIFSIFEECGKRITSTEVQEGKIECQCLGIYEDSKKTCCLPDKEQGIPSTQQNIKYVAREIKPIITIFPRCEENNL